MKNGAAYSTILRVFVWGLSLSHSDRLLPLPFVFLHLALFLFDKNESDSMVKYLPSTNFVLCMHCRLTEVQNLQELNLPKKKINVSPHWENFCAKLVLMSYPNALIC